MVSPKPQPGKATWCADCEYWRVGEPVEVKVLDDDYCEGTAYDDVGWSEYLEIPGCQCEADSDTRTVEPYWVCGHCGTVYGDDIVTANICCKQVASAEALKVALTSVATPKITSTDDGHLTISFT